MSKNLVRYVDAWKLRKSGKTLKEVGKIMDITPERVRIMCNYVTFSLRSKNKDHTALKKLSE